MSTAGRFAAAAAVALSCVATPAPARAQGFSDLQRREIERIVRDYFLGNPEVLQEIIAELEKRQAAAEVEKHKAAVKMNEKLLLNSPRQVTIGNIQGDVTLVEFFDYNCGFCRRALADKC
jgi:protein-disulfide isomerase